MGIKEDLKKYILSIPVVNTHSHHLPNHFFQEMNLGKLLSNSYVNWSGLPLSDGEKIKEGHLDLLSVKSYFVWLEKAIKAIYRIDDGITLKSWDDINEKLRKSYLDADWHIRILADICNYESIILDAYWLAGDDNGLPDVFDTTFRIDTFLYAFDTGKDDHNGISFHDVYDKKPDSLESYINFIRDIIKKKTEGNCRALKSAIAYDRGIDFHKCGKDEAGIVFDKPADALTDHDIKCFQDFVFLEICKMAGDLGIPFQIHTGLGRLMKSNPIYLQEAILLNPDTKFILFHGGFPWVHEISGLLHTYQNVYADICWLPIISPTAAERALHEYLEIGTLDKISWGCDTMTAEESYGALLAAAEVVSNVLSSKIDSGYLTHERAKGVIDRIFNTNAKELYDF